MGIRGVGRQTRHAGAARTVSDLQAMSAGANGGIEVNYPWLERGTRSSPDLAPGSAHTVDIQLEALRDGLYVVSWQGDHLHRVDRCRRPVRCGGDLVLGRRRTRSVVSVSDHAGGGERRRRAGRELLLGQQCCRRRRNHGWSTPQTWVKVRRDHKLVSAPTRSSRSPAAKRMTAALLVAAAYAKSCLWLPR
jgi:hypothetical protein